MGITDPSSDCILKYAFSVCVVFAFKALCTEMLFLQVRRLGVLERHADAKYLALRAIFLSFDITQFVLYRFAV